MSLGLPRMLVIALALGAAPACGLAAGQGFFQRYTPADPVAFGREVDDLRAELARARADGSQAHALELAADLGGMLVSARQEAEARALLAATLRESRAHGLPRASGWALLYLATANQYLGARADADGQFAEALTIAGALGDRELQHYLLHHRGRLLAEGGCFDAARRDFRAALRIRRQLDDARRVASTVEALEALDRLQRQSGKLGQERCAADNR